MIYNKDMLKKIKKFLSTFLINFSATSFIFLLVMPASTDYKLKDYGFGNGGTAGSSAGGFSIEAITGEASGAKESFGSFGIGPGLIYNGQANVPIAPTFTNPSNYYNKLQIVINTSGNPTLDTKYAIAISDDNFTTTNYVQNDHTVGSALGSEDYQTYASWGDTGGTTITGLTPSTTYKVKVKAMQGKFSETDYGPTASAATVSPTLSFDINVTSVTFGNLDAGSVIDSPQSISASLATNGESGGKVYVYGANSGLWSSSKSHKINSLSGDLSSGIITEGFGAQGTLATQSSGGPLIISPTYNLSASNVGIIDSSIRTIFSSANPITGGSGTFILKAKSSSITPAATDYNETLTVIASGSF
jgi:hypothetical protein